MIALKEYIPTKEEQAALEIIRSHNALVAIVFDQDAKGVINYKDIDENYLDQLADPTKNRPSRSARFFQEQGKPIPEVIKKINLQTLVVHDHHPGKCRANKSEGFEFAHTAKTPTSLIPPEPQYMELFFSSGGIGMGWNKDSCNLKNEKYVFTNDGYTDDCYWLDVDTEEKIEAVKKRLELYKPTSIESL